jgi:ABC-type uncharacterized transport system ATPase subunit
LQFVDENGAGKGVLIKMISGLDLPDVGAIPVHGKKTSSNKPQKALSLGIDMVFPQFKLGAPRSPACDHAFP